MFRNNIFPDVDVSHLQYFLELHQNPTFVNADLLGPEKFGILSLEKNKRCITSKQFQLLTDQYNFINNEDYFTRGDVPPGNVSKTKRTIYIISPYVLKTCLTGSKYLGKEYRKYYFFLELTIYAYSDYQKLYVLEDRKSTIKKLEESNKRLEESNARIENKLDTAIDNLDILTELHNDINITENIVTPPHDTELHTQFAVFKANVPEAVFYDRKFHPCIHTPFTEPRRQGLIVKNEGYVYGNVVINV